MVLPGSASTRNAFISVHDAARVMVAAVDATEFGGPLDVGGPEVLTWTDVVRVFGDVLGRPVRIRTTPVAVFTAGQRLLARVAPSASNVMGLNRLIATAETPWDTTEVAGAWTCTAEDRGAGPPREGCAPGGLERASRQLEVGLVELLDVDVLERHHAHVLHEPGRPVHVPDPGVGHRDLEVDLAVGVADLQVDRVGEVEPPLGLHHVGELPDDVAVLAIELQLHLGLVLLEILGAHRRPPWTAGRRPLLLSRDASSARATWRPRRRAPTRCAR